MKIKTLFALMLAIAALASCTDDKNMDPGHQPGDFDVAYISLKVNTPSKKSISRSSTEAEASTAENAIKSLYAITFDRSYKIICFDNDPAVRKLEGITNDGEDTTHEPNVFRVSSGAKGLLLIANPGTELMSMLTNAAEGMTFNEVNAAIENITVAEIKDDDKGFTMINTGDLAASDADPKINAELCLVDLTGKIYVVGDEENQYPTKEAAEEEAKKNRVTVRIERLTSKITVASGITDNTTGTNVIPANKAIFEFKGWVLDATNGSVYPWARKIKLDSSPSGSFYDFNFYTVDPNFLDDTGIRYNPVVDYTPVAFLEKEGTAYCVENTMKSDEQLFKNATRVVIQGNYYPDETWKGNDWFNFVDEDFKDLDALKAAYSDESRTNLRDACERFLQKIKDYDTSITITDFSELQQTHLNKIPNGGQVVKEDKCIRWYKQGLCYYWYEIRHDDAITKPMAFGKYGVVRNNFYALTLRNVKGAGTPWYPEIKNPGDGDPDPEKEIDDFEGYIGVTVEIGEWVRWEHDMNI